MVILFLPICLISKADGTDFSIIVNNPKSLTMAVGETKRYYISHSDQNAEWEILGDNVVIVDPREMTLGERLGGDDFQYPYAKWKLASQYIALYAIKPGKCTLVLKRFHHSPDYESPIYLSTIYLQNVEITVTGSEPQSMVMQHKLHLGIGQEHTLSPMLLPTGTSSTLTWYSSNTSVATVSSAGVITANAVGDATITCVTANGLREDCDVTVTPTMVTSLSLNQEQLMMNVGEQYQLGASVTPQDATYQQVVWKSMNPDVVSVDENGMASCLSNGWSVILATTVDGSNLTAGCFVRVGASDGGDVNNDGRINIQDVTALINYLLNA